MEQFTKANTYSLRDRETFIEFGQELCIIMRQRAKHYHHYYYIYNNKYMSKLHSIQEYKHLTDTWAV